MTLILCARLFPLKLFQRNWKRILQKLDWHYTNFAKQRKTILKNIITNKLIFVRKFLKNNTPLEKELKKYKLFSKVDGTRLSNSKLGFFKKEKPYNVRTRIWINTETVEQGFAKKISKNSKNISFFNFHIFFLSTECCDFLRFQLICCDIAFFFVSKESMFHSDARRFTSCAPS